MPSMEVPVAAIGIRSIQIFNPVVALADKEVVCEHDADEAAHEDTHSGDAREEDGTRDEHFPRHHAPAAYDAANDLPAHDVDVAGCHSGRVDAERNQICNKIDANLATMNVTATDLLALANNIESIDMYRGRRQIWSWDRCSPPELHRG